MLHRRSVAVGGCLLAVSAPNEPALLHAPEPAVESVTAATAFSGKKQDHNSVCNFLVNKKKPKKTQKGSRLLPDSFLSPPLCFVRRRAPSVFS